MKHHSSNICFIKTKECVNCASHFMESGVDSSTVEFVSRAYHIYEESVIGEVSTRFVALTHKITMILTIFWCSYIKPDPIS